MAHLNTYQLAPDDRVSISTGDTDKEYFMKQAAFFNAVRKAEEKRENSIFSKVCKDSVLPGAVEIAKKEAQSERRIQALEKIESIIAMCREMSSGGTTGCKNLEKMLD